MSNFIEELRWRGLLEATTTNAEQTLANKNAVIYTGFDPTASSLHAGSLLQIMNMVRAKQFGHTVIALVGGATALIGDPSGKRSERPLARIQEVEHNSASIEAQLRDLCGNIAVVNNMEWVASLDVISFLRDIGKHFTLNTMLARDAVQARLAEGISYAEFSYMLLQANDFLWLHENMGCDFQLGGSDQWGNIASGVSLVRRITGHTVHGIVSPLIVNSSGIKFGKTEAGAVWLDAEQMSPYEFYQFWINTPDTDVIQYLKFFTFMSQVDIDDLETELVENPELNSAQKRLAADITRFVHGEQGLEEALQITDGFFGVASDLSRTTPAFEVEDAISIVDLAVVCGLEKSKANVRKLIRNGGLYLNRQVVSDINYVINRRTDCLPDNTILLSKGKKKHYVILITRD